MEDIDLIERDPNHINDYVKAEHSMVFAEPIGNTSMDCVWRNGFKCFTCGKSCCYKTYSLFFGLQTALLWGCFVACIAFFQIWYITPITRFLHVCFQPLGKMLKIWLSTFAGPFIEAQGLIFSRIHVTSSEGKPPKRSF